MPNLQQHRHHLHQTIRATDMRKQPPNTTNDHKGQTKMNLLDLIAATEAKEKALAQVASTTDTNWKKQITDIVLGYATDTEFTTDQIWDYCYRHKIDAPHEPRALGAILIGLARKNFIVATDRYRPSHRVECHARPIRVWCRL